MDKYTFGNKLLALRTEKRLTQKELGDILGVTNKSVSKWETGEAMPRTNKVNQIADFFQVSVNELFGQETALTEEQNTNGEQAADRNHYESFYNQRVLVVNRKFKAFFVITLIIQIFAIAIIFSDFFDSFSSYEYNSPLAISFGIILPLMFSLIALFTLHTYNKNGESVFPLGLRISLLSLALSALFSFSTQIIVKDSLLDIVHSIIYFSVFVTLFVLSLRKTGSAKEYNRCKYTLVAAFFVLFILFFFASSDFSFNYSPFFMLMLAEVYEKKYLSLLINGIEEEKESRKIPKSVKIIAITALTLSVLLVFAYIAFPALYLKIWYSSVVGTKGFTQDHDYSVNFSESENPITVTVKDGTLKIPSYFDGKLQPSTVENLILYRNQDNGNNLFFDAKYDDLGEFDFASGFEDETEENAEKAQLFLEEVYKTFGYYPSTYRDYDMLARSINIDEISIFDYKKAALCLPFAVFNYMTPDTNDGYYKLETASFIGYYYYHTVNSKDVIFATIYPRKNGNEVYSITFSFPTGTEYKNDFSKIINSFEIN